MILIFVPIAKRLLLVGHYRHIPRHPIHQSPFHLFPTVGSANFGVVGVSAMIFRTRCAARARLQPCSTRRWHRTWGDSRRRNRPGLNVVKVSVADVRVGCVREWRVRSTNHAKLKLGIVEPVFAKVLHRCPKCRSESVKRSRRGFVERVVLWFLRVRPYRCEKCDTRYWDFASSKKKNQSTEEPKH